VHAQGKRRAGKGKNMSDCEDCDKGEKTIKPERSGIVGSMTIHYPSGHICTASPEWKEMQERIRKCKIEEEDDR
jgi:hypothetical protein